MMAALTRGRAPLRKLLLSPLVAAPLTVLSGVGVGLAAPLAARARASPAAASERGVRDLRRRSAMLPAVQ